MTKFPLYLSIVLGFFLSITITVAATTPPEDTRYFVQTTKGFWKNTLGVRNSFDDGFTSDLTDWQLRLAKLANIKVYPVKKINILPADSSDLEAAIPAINAIKIAPASKRKFPTESVPWNIQMMYGGKSTKPMGEVGVAVAILDTGVFKDHSDLKNRIKECKDFTSPHALVDGKCDDRNGHGTHIAGIVAADGGEDHLGIYGVAPATNLLAYKVCDQNGSCWSDDIAAALRLATDNGANIINLSLGSDQESSLITDAINYATSEGVLVVAAAGNDGPYFGSIDYPAAKSSVISVGAIDEKLLIPDWSSHGINSKTKSFIKEEKDLEMSAPGVNVESTWKDGGYNILSGTSMAAPHITGMAAKLWEITASASADLVRDILHQQTQDLNTPGDDDASGWGLPTF